VCDEDGRCYGLVADATLNVATIATPYAYGRRGYAEPATATPNPAMATAAVITADPALLQFRHRLIELLRGFLPWEGMNPPSRLPRPVSLRHWAVSVIVDREKLPRDILWNFVDLLV